MKWLNLRNPGLFESLERPAIGCIAVSLSQGHREKILEIGESEMCGLPEGEYRSSDGGMIRLSPHEIGGIAIELNGENASWENMVGRLFRYSGKI